MAGVRGLFVRKVGTAGTTPVDARRDIAGLVASTSAFGPRPGVLSGCVVSGTTGWAYSVTAGHLVTSRSAADGALPWAVDAATSVPCSTAPGSGSRVDIVYALHHDVDASDADNLPVLDVVSGTASGGTPTPPSLPAGAIELGRCTLPAGASNTGGGTFSAASVQYTAARGSAIPVASQAQRDALNPVASLTNPITVYRRDTGRHERCVGASWFDIDGQPWAAYTPVLTAATTNPTLGTGSSASGRWGRQGELVTGWFLIKFGTTGVVAGSGTYQISPPTAIANPTLDATLGAAWLLGTSAWNTGIVAGTTESQMQIRPTTGTTVTNTTPWVWAAGHSLRGSFAYEV